MCISASLIFSAQYVSQWTSESAVSSMFVTAEDAADGDVYTWKDKEYES